MNDVVFYIVWNYDTGIIRNAADGDKRNGVKVSC